MWKSALKSGSYTDQTWKAAQGDQEKSVDAIYHGRATRKR